MADEQWDAQARRRVQLEALCARWEGYKPPQPPVGDAAGSAERLEGWLEQAPQVADIDRAIAAVEWKLTRLRAARELAVAGGRETTPRGLTAEAAAAVYCWAVGDGQREPPADPVEMELVGKGLVALVELAGDQLASEPLDLGES